MQLQANRHGKYINNKGNFNEYLYDDHSKIYQFLAIVKRKVPFLNSRNSDSY